MPTADILLLFFRRYSTNEGETWKTFTFSEKPVFVYGLLTEPGEKSTIFTIFGSYKENGHSWLILQINTTDVLGKGHHQGCSGCTRAVLAQVAPFNKALAKPRLVPTPCTHPKTPLSMQTRLLEMLAPKPPPSSPRDLFSRNREEQTF